MWSTLTIVGATLLLAVSAGLAAAQTASPAPIVTNPSSAAVSQALKNLPDVAWAQSPQDLQVHPSPLPLPARSAGPGPHGSDTALQKFAGAPVAAKTAKGFPGIGANGFIPPDPNIAVGPTYIVQTVNSQIAVYNKSGTLLSGPKSLSNIWAPLGGPCARNNAGDPIVQYDLVADAWLVTQLGSVRKPFSQCIAVSTTNDPRGTYHLYSYSFGTNLNDYPKFGVWPTTGTNPAYLATYNIFANGQSFSGGQLCAYDRTAMLAGKSSPVSICYLISNDGGYLPADLDGPAANIPPAGSPGYFLNFQLSTDSLRLYELTPNFLVPTSSTLTWGSDFAVLPFAEACNGGACIPQPGTTRQLDSLGDRLMYRLAYRNFGTQSAGLPQGEAMVVNHSVAVAGPPASVGVRWYQLTADAATPGAWGLAQQGTYAPDSTYRWMGSAAMDKSGDIALGYSSSSSLQYPAIVATYRCPTTPLGIMGGETAIQAGHGSQTGYTRWGDYTSLRIDPSDDATFWYTNEFYTQSASYLWRTFIGSFTVGACP